MGAYFFYRNVFLLYESNKANRGSFMAGFEVIIIIVIFLFM